MNLLDISPVKTDPANKKIPTNGKTMVIGPGMDLINPEILVESMPSYVELYSLEFIISAFLWQCCRIHQKS